MTLHHKTEELTFFNIARNWKKLKLIYERPTAKKLASDGMYQLISWDNAHVFKDEALSNYVDSIFAHSDGTPRSLDNTRRHSRAPKISRYVAVGACRYLLAQHLWCIQQLRPELDWVGVSGPEHSCCVSLVTGAIFDPQYYALGFLSDTIEATGLDTGDFDLLSLEDAIIDYLGEDPDEYL